ncbi:lasso peptide isopeptide bond-forming cyclase [Caulobacter segnis]|uniref:Asparagine synthase n=2 Tax=Caulobacter segnis TaxID=88688 RepID=D5VKJ5_CAUST|nr:lasso peptide isopeptide bond-forming cyclase [Caulobacter segnis]ADG11018.1 asparagine synthase [Caulobacter segnis ATCC 21756]AVQ02708.1 lasso peptide isopeptide bond-forming cyclase [Caulobacter segnis]
MGYAALTYPGGLAAAAFDEMVEALIDAGWTLALRAFRLAVLTDGQAPAVSPLMGRGGVAGVLIGEAFDRRATLGGAVARAALDGLADIDPLEAGRHLIETAWGGYVGMWIGRAEAGPTLLRDPSGALEALAWRRDGVTVMSARPLTGRAGPADLAIDWPRIVQILADPISAALGPPPLTGLATIDPGAAVHGADGQERSVLWTPAAVVRGARHRPWPSRQDLRRTIDATVAALASDAGPIVCEISGGLDSAIVATSLAASGLGPQLTVNFYGDQPEADERGYAQAVAERIGAPLRTLRREPFAFDETVLAAAGQAARPNFNALDPGYDAGLVGALEAIDARALFTGHGGDTVFYQVAASALAADLLGGAPCEGSRRARLEEVARRTRRSIWSLAWEAFSGRPSTVSIEGQLLRQEAERIRRVGLTHPWVGGLSSVTPAKRQQIRALVSNLNAHGATGRAERARIVHPLLAQPVVEACLAIPAPILSAGEGERSFAREAFADRLPPSIVGRRSKGEISVFLNRSLAASAPFLRGFLLEGRLAARGLIDRDELAAALEPEAIVWKDASRDLLTAAALEAWVRHWEARIGEGEAAEGERAAGRGTAATGPRTSARKANTR